MIDADERARRLAQWDARYEAEAAAGTLPTELSAPLPALLARLPPGRALDVACGAGRHALALAAADWRVDAVDGSAAAIKRLTAASAKAGLRDRITPIVADLMTDPPGFEPEEAAYDLVCVFYFLDRALWPSLRAAVRPGGRLAAAIHLAEPGAAPHPRRLAPDELFMQIASWGWTLETYREATEPEPGHGHGTAVVIARR